MHFVQFVGTSPGPSGEGHRLTTPEVARALGLSDRMARVLVQGWVADGWLVVARASKRARAYGLAENYRQFIGNLSATAPREP